jgi:hypothetical protein
VSVCRGRAVDGEDDGFGAYSLGAVEFLLCLLVVCGKVELRNFHHRLAIQDYVCAAISIPAGREPDPPPWPHQSLQCSGRHSGKAV